MDVWILLSFLAFLGFFAAVGLASMRVKQDTTDDYLVAGRGMHPALAALSAVSTWNSGYMFIGFIGFTYMMGYSVIWIGLFSTIGQLLAWAWLYKFIQQEGSERGVRSLSSLVAEKAGAPEAKLAAILSVFFLCIYAAAQLTAGGKALLVMMGWSEIVGILIGFVLVVAYCYAGGIRASIWTDAAQSCVMIVGSIILCWIALGKVGGFSGLNDGLSSEGAYLVNLLPPDLSFGIALYILAFFLGGLGVAGQPQVVSRVMTLDSDKDRKQAMIWFFVWQTPFILIMLIIGMVSRVLFTASQYDPELSLPQMAMETMPPIGVGMILASIFAATMSTADSQVLACTAAITDDIKPEWNQNHKRTKQVTLVVAAIATSISIAGLYIPGGDSVFTLVVLAVYGLGGVFVPLLILRWGGYKPDSTHSIIMMISAFVGVIIWVWLGFGEDVFPSVPGMGAAFASHFLMCAFREESDSNALGRFKLPEIQKRQFVGYGISLLFIVGVVEGTYAIYAPDSSADSDAMDRVGNWNVSVFETVTILHETKILEDGETHDTLFEVNPDLNIGYVVFDVDCEDTAPEPGDWTDRVDASSDVSEVEGDFEDQSASGECATPGDEGIEIRWDVTARYIGQDVHDGGNYSYVANNTSEAELRETWTDGGMGGGTWSATITADVNSPPSPLGSIIDSDEEYEILWVVVTYEIELHPIS